MAEFSGEVGTVYVQRDKDSDQVEYDVWFEDFFILGTGVSKLEALKDAKRCTLKITQLIDDAIESVAAAASTAGGGE